MKRSHVVWVGIAAPVVGAMALALVNAEAPLSVFVRLWGGLLLVAAPGFSLGRIPKDRKRVKIVALLLMHGGFMVLSRLPNGLVVSLLSGLSVALYNGAVLPLLRRKRKRAAVLVGVVAAVVFPLTGFFAGLSVPSE
jgi:hypothetical protein